MSKEFQIYISRDSRNLGSSDHIHLWVGKPEYIKGIGRSKAYTGERLGMLRLEDVGKLGSEFKLKPGQCKPVVWVMD